MPNQSLIEGLCTLGQRLLQEDETQMAYYNQAYNQNRWFTIDHIQLAVRGIVNQFLNKQVLVDWLARYPQLPTESPKRVAIIMAGNIPLVGFHDFLSVYLSGHHVILKFSNKDKVLLPFIIEELKKIDPKAADRIEVIDRIQEVDAVIATGSNNSSRYFEKYFGKYPNIIRKNRTSVAILNGEETEEDLMELGKDIFRYFGLGCRSISKIYVPEGYDLVQFLDQLEYFKDYMNHHKFKNNFDYNLSIYMLNRVKHYQSSSILLVEDQDLHSRIACLHYEFYKDEEDLINKIKPSLEAIQCIAANRSISGLSTVKLGTTQMPAINDYADDKDTMQFLMDL